MYENTALNSTSICFLTHRAGVSVEKQVPTGAFPSLHPRRVWQVGAFSPLRPPGRGPAFIPFPCGGDSHAMTIKKVEKPFAFFLGVNDLPNQC